MVALGQTLDLRVIAEGIEQPGQLDQLRDLGCEFGQGYLFARPGDGPSIAARFLPPLVDLTAARQPGADRPRTRSASRGSIEGTARRSPGPAASSTTAR